MLKRKDTEVLKEDLQAGGSDATLLKAQDTFYSVRVKCKLVNEQESRVDALALRADERRNKLRKAAGRCK